MTDRVLAALQIAAGDLPAAAALLTTLAQLDTFAEHLTEADSFRVVIRGVVRVKSDNGAPGKARIDFVSAADGEIESIETDWLSFPLARHIAHTAKRGIGRGATLWKLNAKTNDPKRPHGFRRVVWIDTDPEEVR